MAGSPTVTQLLIQMQQLAKNQDQLRGLLVEVIGDILKVTQVQAESNVRFLKLIEDQSQAMRLFTAVGPGTTRAYTEADEAREWREQVDAASRRDVETE